MYLILTDPTARTVRVEHIKKALLNLRWNIQCRLRGMLASKDESEALAKSIAIKENLVYTPITEL
jgi:inorganic pyrophosphatase